jgi:predicted DNA-binding protein (UPF0251 family)
MAELKEEVLTVEEIEALRLKDLEGMEQDECAERMGISQSTFQRMLARARFKLAKGLVEARSIRIEGGNYELAGNRLRCLECGMEWEGQGTGRAGDDKEVPPVSCPKCGWGPVAVVSGPTAGHPGRSGGPRCGKGGYGPRWRW